MKIWVLTLSLIFSSVFAFADTPTIWVSTRTDGLPGTGTQSDPINLSTPARFDAYFQARYQAHYSNYNSTDPVIFRFLPGTYTSNSMGIWAISGWQLLGSGQGSTILHFPAVVYGSATGKQTTRLFCIRCNWGSIGITVQDMTIDGGVRDTGTALSSSFVMPPPQESVTIAVPNASKLIVGKWYYVQDTAMTNNMQQWWGIVTCTAIQGNNVTLKNAEVATPGVVTGDVTAGSAVVTHVSSMEHLDESQPVSSSVFPNGATTVVSLDSPTQMTMYLKSNVTAKHVPLTYGACFTDNLSGPVLSTACLFPYSGRAGVVLQSNNIVVQRVTVQDVAMPFYEGTAGIELGNQAVTHQVGSGNLIDHCTVQDVFGRYAWYLAANSAGNPAIDTGVTEEVTISNNTVLGNGYYQGIDVYNISNSVISGNNVRNVNVGFFCDTDYNRGITVINNIFTGANGTHIGVGAPAYFSNSAFKNNVIILTSLGTAIGVDGNMSNVVVSENTLSMTSSALHSKGIIAGGYSPGSSGALIFNNQILSSLINQGIETDENQMLTLDQINESLAALGLTDTGDPSSASSQAVASSSPASSPPVTETTAPSASTVAKQSAAAASSGVGSAVGQASLVDRINQAVASMQALSTSGRGGGVMIAGGSSSQENSRDVDEADERRVIAQLDALVRQMNDEQQVGVK